MIDKKKLNQLIKDIIENEILIEAKAEGLTDAEEIKVTVTDKGFSIVGPEKYKWVQLGRKSGSGKGTRVPIENLILWIRKNGITPSGNMSINSLAWAIQTSIYQSGIKTAVAPRPFIERALTGIAAKVQAQLGTIIK